ncbi:hypothetical protein WN943_012033 [Citrus x changshan-huyou]
MGTGSSKEDSSSQLQPSEKPSQNESQNFAIAAKPADNTRETQVREAREAELKLPHMYEAIVKDADSPIDKSSVDKLYDQLYCGVFLNQKSKRYWVEKKSGCNSFMLFSRALLITWAEDNRFWIWTPVKESSDDIMDVAELVQVCWLEIHARLDTTKLSPGISYEVLFVIMLKDPAYGWEVPVSLRLLLPNGTKQEHKENLIVKPRNQWIEIPVGGFKSTPENAGEMEISMYEYEGGKWKRGLVVKGVIIRPKKLE